MICGLRAAATNRECLQNPSPVPITLEAAGRSMPITLTVNGRKYTLDADDYTPLLWAIRDGIGLTGTKFGCGIAQCGACTVYVDNQPVRSW